MKLLIAVISFQGDAENGNHDKIRRTWGKDVGSAGADLRFFIGRRDKAYQPKPDETLIPWQEDGTRTCAHPYWHAEPGCTCVEYWQVLYRGILDWSIRNGYDFTFLAENDTFLVPRKLTKTGFENYDYSGYMMYTHAEKPDQFYSEPGGYFLSKRAAETILKTAPNHLHFENLACDVLRPLAAKGEMSIKSLEHFWNESMYHYRAQGIMHPVIRDGYPSDSNWMAEMYARHGADE
jgi:hypothetical protein